MDILQAKKIYLVLHKKRLHPKVEADDVTVFDKQKYAAMETSYANGGQLSACNGEVWTNWKTIYQGIQWIFKKDAPLSINLKPSLHKIGWFLSFLSNVKNHEKNTIATVKMAIESGNLLK